MSFIHSTTVRAELVEARLVPTPFDKLRANGSFSGALR